MEVLIALVALIVSILSLGMSFYFWRRQFRPILTLAVRTVSAENTVIAYSLQVKNSGSIPAKDIKLKIQESNLEQALGVDATAENKERWIEAVNSNTIHILQNGDIATCSFGTSEANDQGFWKYGAMINVDIKYFGWFGYTYTETQTIKVQDSGSFTGYMWGTNA
ncbi:MAG: hypothetical protein U0586_03890 [Candidatus Brocadiaceae bacterium]